MGRSCRCNREGLPLLTSAHRWKVDCDLSYSCLPASCIKRQTTLRWVCVTSRDLLPTAVLPGVWKNSHWTTTCTDPALYSSICCHCRGMQPILNPDLSQGRDLVLVFKFGVLRYKYERGAVYLLRYLLQNSTSWRCFQTPITLLASISLLPRKTRGKEPVGQMGCFTFHHLHPLS